MNVILEFNYKIDINKISDLVFDDKKSIIYFKYDNKKMEAVVKETLGRYVAIINEEQTAYDKIAKAKRCYNKK